MNSGTLVKCGDEVRVAVRGAVEGDDLGALRARVEAEFREHDEEERDARAALARLEASMIRRFRDLGNDGIMTEGGDSETRAHRAQGTADGKGP